MKHFGIRMRALNSVRESMQMAISSLCSDRFRTFLTLLAVSVGIFTIVAILTLVDSIRYTLDDNLRALGQDVVYVQDYSLFDEPEEDEVSVSQSAVFDSWPPVTYADYLFLQEYVELPKKLLYFSSFISTVSSGRHKSEENSIYVFSSGMEQLFSMDLSEGRMISATEYDQGAPVAVLGYEVAQTLFPEEKDIMGKTVHLGMNPVKVIGVLSRRGKSLIQIFDFDHAILFPLKSAWRIDASLGQGGIVMSAPGVGVDSQTFRNELTCAMRNQRRLRPMDSNNFALNEINRLGKMMDTVFVMLNTLGWLLGIFSLLIGGFGIANIMFVSVQEKTAQIGIQKALGSRDYLIMCQYLTESALLSLGGGILGVLLVGILVSAVRSVTFYGAPVSVFLSLDNLLLGLIVSVFIGLVSGISPAWKASRLDPVLAISRS